MLKEIKIEADPSFKNTLDLDALLSPTVDVTTTVGSPRGKIQRSQTEKNIDISIEDLKFDPRTTYIIHTVDPKDTLQGLALRYCVTVQEIKKVNKIYNPTAIYSQKQLVIPVRHAELLQRLRSRTNEKEETEKEKQEIVKHFIQITNSTEAEALQYLKLTQFNLELAIEKHQLGNMTMPKKIVTIRPFCIDRQQKTNHMDGSATESSPILQNSNYYSYNSSFTHSPKSVSPERSREENGFFDFI